MISSIVLTIKQLYHKYIKPSTAAPAPTTVNAYRIYTGPDDHSYVEKIQIPCMQRYDVSQIYLQTSPPGSVYEIHNAPQKNYVITLRGTLKFMTSLGEIFVIQAGDILLAEDVTGYGHSWKLLGDEPWIRAYVTLPI
jgi:hypothetical protein